MQDVDAPVAPRIVRWAHLLEAPGVPRVGGIQQQRPDHAALGEAGLTGKLLGMKVPRHGKRALELLLYILMDAGLLDPQRFKAGGRPLAADRGS